MAIRAAGILGDESWYVIGVGGPLAPGGSLRDWMCTIANDRNIAVLLESSSNSAAEMRL